MSIVVVVVAAADGYNGYVVVDDGTMRLRVMMREKVIELELHYVAVVVVVASIFVSMLYNLYLMLISAISKSIQFV